MSACSSSTFISGDKNLSEVKETVSLIRDQIDIYRDMVEEMRYEGVADTSHTITVLQDKIADLNGKIDNLLSMLSEKDSRRDISLESHSAKDLANAYVAISYVDNIAQDSSKKLTGIIKNLANYSVIAQVRGNNFYQELSINRRSTSSVFNLPAPGWYTVKFINAYGSYSITKKVGPGIKYFNDNGKSYDFMATLFR